MSNYTLEDFKIKKIILEGITGCGKSTSIPYIKNYLEDKGLKTFVADCNSEAIKSTSNTRKYINSFDDTLLPQLFIHQVHSYSKILTKDNIDVMIVDRFVLSNIAYTLARLDNSCADFDEEKVVNWFLYPLGEPTLKGTINILFDVDTEVAEKRVLLRDQKTHEGDIRNTFDFKLQSAANYYFRKSATNLKTPYYIVDADKNKEEVKSQLEKILSFNF